MRAAWAALLPDSLAKKIKSKKNKKSTNLRSRLSYACVTVVRGPERPGEASPMCAAPTNWPTNSPCCAARLTVVLEV